jgi:threonine synthase
LDHVTGLRCTICGETYDVDEAQYVCPRHGDDGILDVVYDYDLIASRIDLETLTGDAANNMWRYTTLLPVDPDAARATAADTVVSTVGGTPLFPAPRLASELGLSTPWQG